MTTHSVPVRAARRASLIPSLRWSGALTLLALWEVVLLICLAVGICLSVIVVGIPLVAWSLEKLRAQSNRQRRFAGMYAGLRLPDGDVDLPVRGSGLRKSLIFVFETLDQRMTKRELLWLLTNPVVGLFTALLPLAAIANGLFGLSILFLWPALVAQDTTWYLFVPVTGIASSVVAALLGLAQILLGLALVRSCLRFQGRWVGARLSSTSTVELQERVETLATSRADVVEFQARELERIERDLHDGAQARLVAMGMTLTAASRLIASDPDRANTMLLEARDSSSAALQELRNLVRGIHPPVLADRGLAEAIRSLAMESVLPVEVQASMARRPPLPVESAVFFAVSELLANVSKHAGATRALVSLTDHDGFLTAAVKDDGRGGALVVPGSGLAGIERRLAAFDGAVGIGRSNEWTTVVTLTMPLRVTTKLTGGC